MFFFIILPFGSIEPLTKNIEIDFVSVALRECQRQTLSTENLAGWI